MRGGMRGGRGRGGFPPFGMVDFRGGNRGRMIDHRLMGNMGIQVRHCALTCLNPLKGTVVPPKSRRPALQYLC